ncbi:hypothetical protein BD626DRAFT_536395 [Schizophyllum amplum]|uniref:THUMP domain-containing protein n=1 Tax=Schizophyllum amplum TaxID=97359 RepID=A0A550CHY4_9AGAR|nr:hypothetical protein BD626DRAFT_536395 [Auriculariopsis ampla]
MPKDTTKGPQMSHNRTKEGKKKKYRSDGTPIWSKATIEGPGIWATCVKGKERQAVGELYDLLESLSTEIWPPEQPQGSSEAASNIDSEGEEELSIEAQIAKEVSAIKRPAAEKRILVFMACRAPVDPVILVTRHMKNVETTGITRTRNTHRLLPVSGSCTTNIPEIQALCRDVFDKFTSKRSGAAFKYKIELRIRNHSTLTRNAIIQGIAECVPPEFAVDLNEPDVFILVEVFKSVCGIGIVEDYYRLHKFNVAEVAKMCKTGSEEQQSLTRLDKPAGSTQAPESASLGEAVAVE